jgi:hypothetical protein
MSVERESLFFHVAVWPISPTKTVPDSMSSPSKITADFDLLDRLHRLPDTCFLTTSEAAVFLRSSVSSLERMRRDGTGPLYTQDGGKGARGINQKCFYEKSDLLAWQRKNKVASSMQAAVRKGHA